MRISDWSSDVCSSDLNAILRESAIHGCIDRGLASIRVQRRAPVSSSGRHGLRDEHSVLQCPRHAAHTDPGCTCLGVGTARDQQQAHSRLSLGSHGQWKLTVIANSDAGTHAFQIEHLQFVATLDDAGVFRSEEHTSELQSLMRISYAVFCLKKKKQRHKYTKCVINRQKSRMTKQNTQTQ